MAELLRSFFTPGDSKYFSSISPTSPLVSSRTSPFTFSYAHPQAQHPQTAPPPPPPPQQIQALSQTEQTSQTPSPPEEPSKPDPPKKKYPKGVVLGADGKPCRSCTSFAAWSQLASTTSSPPPHPPTDCPPTTETLGASTWTFLHTLTAHYPTHPTPPQQAQMTSFLRLFSELYPCPPCAADFRAWIADRGGDADLEHAVRSRAEFGTWMCDAHNEVNRKLGKEVFDCRRWEERWRDGWADGRCG